MSESSNIKLHLRERGGQETDIDFASVSNLLVAGGSVADRQTIFDAVSRQVPPDRVYTIGSDDIDGAEYDLIDITQIALADYKRTDSTDAALQERFVIIEDLAPLLKADEGFFTESVMSLRDWVTHGEVRFPRTSATHLRDASHFGARTRRAIVSSSVAR